MDPNPKSFPILSYVMNRIPSIGPRFGTSPRADSCSCSIQVDIEQPATPPPSDPSSSSSGQISDHMPHLTNPKVLAAMTRAVGDVAQTRSVLKTLGERPDHETVDAAKARLAEIEHNLSKQLEEIVLSPRPADVDRLEYRTHQAEKETDVRKAAEREKQGCKAVLQLHEMHDAYEKLLRQAEERLVKIYRSVEAGEEQVWEEEGEEKEVVKEEINEEVVGILHEADGKVLERVDLSDRQIRFLPEAFGRISGLVVLNLSGNQLQVIPDSIAGLEKLEELNASSNLLESLPDSIGLLQKLKLLNVAGNKLKALPDSICSCRSLVELDVGFNDLTYLPTNLGYELVNLQKLDIQLNKLQSIPSSVCEMRSLLFLDAHFNEIRGLPLAIGKLINLEYLNLSSNFSDLKELPDTFGDLTNLQELDLSNNQIRVLPDTFGCLDNLKKLNLEQNPIVIPPPEVINDGVEAVKIFMAKRWLEILVEVERKSMVEVQEEDQQTGWLTRSTSWLKTYALNVYGSVSEYVGSPKSPRDLYLDHQP